MPSRRVKRVRFAYKNIIHSPPPAPAISDPSSSLPSTTDLITPESTESGLPRLISANKYPDYPSYLTSVTMTREKTTSHRFYIIPHTYLETSVLVLSWDVRDSTIHITSTSVSSWTRTLHGPATDPPLSHIRITSPYLPWPIHCIPAPNGAWVTLDDIFRAIYHSLRTNVRPSEFSMLTSPCKQRRASRAYEERYRRHRNSCMYEDEKRGGMKRVDFLRGRTHFCGIVPSSGVIQETII